MTRDTLLVIVGALALGGIIGSHTCPRPASGQLPPSSQNTAGLPAFAPKPPFPAVEEHLAIAYGRQIERLYGLLYEGYITRPGNEAEEDEKFMRGLRIARVSRDRARLMYLAEPWHVVTPVGTPPGRSGPALGVPQYRPVEPPSK
jgi:hypothetical protein